MVARQRYVGGIVLVLAFLVSRPGAASEPVLPVAVRDGQCTVVLAAPNPDDKYVVVVGSLSRKSGPYRVHLSTTAAAGPEEIPLENTLTDPGWARGIAKLRDRLDRARRTAVGSEEFPPSGQPARERIFHVFVRTDNFQDADGYTAVTADLHAVGKHCQVYVDKAWPDLEGLKPTIADAVKTFDDEVYPQAREHLGRVLDVDRDGRFTLLFTGWLAKLCDGKVALGGFVRGSDFYRDLAAPFGNRCDMMYLNADLKPGPHLRTLIAHEYTHAVLFSEHVFGNYLPEFPTQEEESWLNEGLAHLNEARHAYGWSNLDYRMSAFLTAPQRYPLGVKDYYGAGVWRSPGHRGAAFLFLDWCRQRFGPDLAARLVQSNLAGTENLEVATNAPFAELFRQWTVALATGEAGRPRGDAPPMGRLLGGPRFVELPLSGSEADLEIAGTTAAYLLLHSPQNRSVRLTVRAEAEAELQVSLIRLPRPRGRLSVTATSEGKTVRLSVTAHDADVTLQDVAWEWTEATTSSAEETSYRPEMPPGETVRAWFGDGRIRAGETRTSGPMVVPDRSVIFKVLGSDATGRLAGWAADPRSASRE